MALFQTLLDGLRRAESELEAQLAGVKAAISSLANGPTGRKRGRPAGAKNKASDKGIIIVGGKAKRKRRKMSLEARAKIAAAQRKRWAKQKSGAKVKRVAAAD